MPAPKDPQKAQAWKDKLRSYWKGKSQNVGINNPFYGKKHTKLSISKISRAATGSNNPMFGKNHSIETRKKMRIASAKRPPRPHIKIHFSKSTIKALIERNKKLKPMLGKHLSESHKKLLRMKRLGTKLSEKTKNKISKSLIKRYAGCYFHDMKKLRHDLLELNEYREWKSKILFRDHGKCVRCGTRINIHVHHKIWLSEMIYKLLLKHMSIKTKDLIKFKPLWDIKNGICLCEFHHMNEHRKRNYPTLFRRLDEKN